MTSWLKVALRSLTAGSHRYLSRGPEADRGAAENVLAGHTNDRPRVSRLARAAFLESLERLEQKVKPHENRDASGTEKRVEKVFALFRHLGGLDAKIDFEYSFKTVHSHLFENRFLLGVHRRQTEGSLDERIALICERIGMPHNLLASLKGALPDANHVYFGVEKNEKTLIFKAYLEFRDKIEKEIGGTCVAGRSFPLFTGFKWDTSSPSRQAVTRYAWYPSLPVPEMLERLRMAIDPRRHRGLFETLLGITKRASERITPRDMQYLEVIEDGNPRRSFDINIYKAGHRLKDLCPFLLRAVRHYAIPSGRFQPVYERVKTERFGHLAGGVDREDRDFMTVYYGARQIDSDQLRSAVIVRGAAQIRDGAPGFSHAHESEDLGADHCHKLGFADRRQEEIQRPAELQHDPQLPKN
jgi:hypothetical protein